jgi:cation:H+ antiporter
MIDVVLVAGGLLGLVLGGGLLVNGAVAAATRLGVSPMVIGLTLVGFGTSTPELVTSIQAALAGAPGLALGNVVGSNIANILLILGVAACIRPIAVQSEALMRDGSIMALATLACAGLIAAHMIGPLTGALFLLTLLGYLGLTLHMGKRRSGGPDAVYAAEAEVVPPSDASPLRIGVWLVGGFALTLLSAQALVSGAVSLAQALGVSDAVIGVTIVAVGTSLPELITSITAARKGHADVAFGNVIGSNIFNILGILGATALLGPMQIPPSLAQFDIWVMVAATLALGVLAVTGWRITRTEGMVLLAGYGAYMMALLAML